MKSSSVFLTNVQIIQNQAMLSDVLNLINESYCESHELNLYDENIGVHKLSLCHEHITVGVILEGRVVSTMTISFVNNVSETKRELMYSGRLPCIHFPAAIFQKAATKISFQGIGLNTLLRFYCILLARQENIESILGIMPLNAQRSGFLRSLGYEVVELEDRSTFVRSVPQLVVLRKLHFEFALEVLQEKVANIRVSSR